MKVGQWVRFEKYDEDRPTICEIYGISKDWIEVEIDKYSTYSYMLDDFFKTVLKLSNTPQELIQKDDLVEYSFGSMRRERNNVERVLETYDNTHCMTNWIDYLDYKRITAIYTPNKDKTQYTLQWKKEASYE